MTTGQADLIYDLGMHDGQDTAYYLKKGFRVIAVEANPDLVAGAAARFADQIAAGQLQILNVAVADARTAFDFYVNHQNSKWSSIHHKWGARGARGFTKITVPGRRLEDIIAEHGLPYYLKIDIEGADLTALEALQPLRQRPDFVSVEGGGETFLNLFARMGYDRFAVVNQATLPKLPQADPAREGHAVDHVFPMGASGPFGREVAAPWMDYDAALEERRAFRAIIADIETRMEGDSVKINRERQRRNLGWYDVHATTAAALG